MSVWVRAWMCGYACVRGCACMCGYACVRACRETAVAAYCCDKYLGCFPRGIALLSIYVRQLDLRYLHSTPSLGLNLDKCLGMPFRPEFPGAENPIRF